LKKAFLTKKSKIAKRKKKLEDFGVAMEIGPLYI